MSVFVKPLIDLIPVWQCDRNWSKMLYGTIPNPVHDIKVKVTDSEFLYKCFLFCLQFQFNGFESCLARCVKFYAVPSPSQYSDREVMV